MWTLTPSEFRKSPTGRACSFVVGAGSAEAVCGTSTGTPTSPATSAVETSRAARPDTVLADRRVVRACRTFSEREAWSLLTELGQDLAPAARDIDTAGDLFGSWRGELVQAGSAPARDVGHSGRRSWPC